MVLLGSSPSLLPPLLLLPEDDLDASTSPSSLAALLEARRMASSIRSRSASSFFLLCRSRSARPPSRPSRAPVTVAKRLVRVSCLCRGGLEACSAQGSTLLQVLFIFAGPPASESPPVGTTVTHSLSKNGETPPASAAAPAPAPALQRSLLGMLFYRSFWQALDLDLVGESQVNKTSKAK